jgi:ATP-dependent Zn protease
MFQTQQYAGQQIRPQQYSYGTVSGYYPLQTSTDFSSIFSSMMPMIMMIMMMAILMPMMKNMTSSSKS